MQALITLLDDLSRSKTRFPNCSAKRSEALNDNEVSFFGIESSPVGFGWGARLSGLSLDATSEWPQCIELRCFILPIWSSGPQRLDSGNTHAAVRRNFLEFPVFRAGMRGSIFDPEADREERTGSGDSA